MHVTAFSRVFANVSLPHTVTIHAEIHRVTVIAQLGHFIGIVLVPAHKHQENQFTDRKFVRLFHRMW